MDSLTSFYKDKGMEFAVRIVAKFLTDKFRRFGRDILMTHGMEQFLPLLDVFSEVVINDMLKFVLNKIALAAYDLLAIRRSRTTSNSP